MLFPCYTLLIWITDEKNNTVILKTGSIEVRMGVFYS